MKETNDELIRQGNALMAAARSGQVGLQEDEIRSLQTWYLKSSKNGWSMWIPAFSFFLLGTILIVSGFNLANEEARAALNGIGAEGSEGGKRMFFGFATCVGSAVWAIAILMARSKGKKYVALVAEEYPKVKTAA